MNIQDLPNGLKELALVRHSEEKNKALYYSATILNDSFQWDKTKEGYEFWDYINIGDTRGYYDLYPQHSWALDYPDEYQVVADAFGNTIVAKVGDYVCPPFDAAHSIGAKLHEDVDISPLTITPAVLANGYYAGEDQIPEVYEAWAKGYEYALETFGIDNTITNLIPDNTFKGMPNNPLDVVYVDTSTTLTEDANLTGGSGEVLGIKENQGKLSYELDWEFIELIAARMSKNKGKYPAYNWHKPIEVEKLKQSLIRHVVEIMKSNYEDDGEEFGHLSAAALNTMMLNYQLKLKKGGIQSRG